MSPLGELRVACWGRWGVSHGGVRRTVSGPETVYLQVTYVKVLDEERQTVRDETH